MTPHAPDTTNTLGEERTSRDVVDGFLSTLSASTARCYAPALSHVAPTPLTPLELHDAIADGYDALLADLDREPSAADAAAYRSLIRHCIRHDLLPENTPLPPTPASPTPSPSSVNLEFVQRLLDTPPTALAYSLLRGLTMAHLSFDARLTPSQIHALRRSDIRPQTDGTVHLVAPAPHQLSPVSAGVLREFLERPETVGPALITDLDGKRMKYRTSRQDLVALCRYIGLPRTVFLLETRRAGLLWHLAQGTPE